MANSVIQIKTSLLTARPPSLNVGELAYSYASNTAFIGLPDTNIIPIGGKFYVDQQQYIYNQANAAFITANAVSYYANLPSHVANSASTYANIAFDLANAASIHANSGFIHANAAFNSANSITIGIGAAYNQANAAFDTANSAAIAANTPSGVANAAYNQANAAFNRANTSALSVSLIDDANVFSNNVTQVTGLRFDSNSGFDITDLGSGNVRIGMNSTFKTWKIAGQQDLIANGLDTIAFVGSNGVAITSNTLSIPKSITFDTKSLFDVSNAAFIHANSAFAAANNVGPQIQPAFNTSNAAFDKANSAAIAANTPSHVANAASVYANASFIIANSAAIAANTPSHVANSAGTYANAAFIIANSAAIAANTPSSVANGSYNHANAAFIIANSAAIAANTPSHVANSSSVYANAAFIWANAAYNKANTDKANLVNSSYTAQLHSNGAFALPGTLIFGPSKGKITNESVGVLAITANSGNTGIVLDDAGQAVVYGKTGVLIQTNEGIFDSAPKNFTFGADGTLTLPDSSGQIGRYGYTNGIDLYNNNGGTGYVRLNYADQSVIWGDAGGAHIQAAGTYTWDFDTDGKIKFPDATIQNTAFQGYGIDNVARYTANSAAIAANTPSSVSNAAFLKANAAYDQANTNKANLVNSGYTAQLYSNGSLILPGSLVIANDIRTQPGQYLVISSDTSTEMNWQGAGGPNVNVYAGLGSDGNLGTSISTAKTDEFGNYVFRTWRFGYDGNLSFPDSTLQNTAFQGYGVDNVARYTANSASSYANAAFNIANSAAIAANTPSHVANSAAIAANTPSYAANTAWSTANIVFTFANAAFNIANSAAIAANTPSHVANSASSYANASFIHANSAYATANVKTQTFVQDTAPASANVDDIWIDSSTGIQYFYINSNTANQWVEFSAYSSPLNGTANIQFADQTIFTVDSTRDLVITNPSSANIKLISGNTVITGNLIADASGKDAFFNNIRTVFFRVNTATTIANSAAVNIVGSTGYYTQAPTSNGYMIQITGNDNSTSRVVNDSAGAGVYSAFIGRHARGTHQNPTAAQENDLLARFSGNGYGVTGYGVNAGGASMDVYATENYTDVARGSKLVFSTTANGTNTRTVSATMDANTTTFVGTVAPQKGFVYPVRKANVANSVAVTIDFANDAIVRCTVNADMSVYFTNYITGKIVDLWVTNLSGTNKKITHGVSATNSTDNAVDKNIPGTSTAKFQYYSIDGNLANTFVAITQG